MIYAVIGTIGVVVLVYLYGRTAGRDNEKAKQDEETLARCILAKRVDDMPDDDIKRMPSKYD